MNKHPKIIHIYFKKLQENGPELDHEKNNKLQNNLLCLKSFMYLLQNSHDVVTRVLIFSNVLLKKI